MTKHLIKWGVFFLTNLKEIIFIKFKLFGYCIYLQICDLIYKDFLIISYVVEVEIWGMGMGYDIDKLELIEVY